MDSFHFKQFRDGITPRKEFSQQLREKILSTDPHKLYQKTSEDYFAEYIAAEGKTVEVEVFFRKKLRQKLIQKMTPRSPFRFLFPRFGKRDHTVSPLVRFAQISTSVVTTVAIVFTTLLFGVSPATQAASKTSITEYFGTIEITTKEEKKALISSPDTPLLEGTILTTAKDSGAVISFFEDSVLRMDEDTTLFIEELSPHPSQDDLGRVSIILKSGRIWLRTFPVDEQYSQFLFTLGSSQILLDPGGAIDGSISNSGHLQKVRVWDRAIEIRSGEEEFFLPMGKKVTKDFLTFSIDSVSLEEEYSRWVKENLKKDEKIIEEFVAEKIEQKKIITATKMQKLREAFVSPFSGDTKRQLSALEELYFEMLSHTLIKETSNITPDVFEKAVLSIAEEDQEEVLAFLASTEKMLSSVMPDSPLFEAKKVVEDLQNTLTQKPAKIVREQVRTRRLWEATQLAQDGNVTLAQEIVEEVSEDDSSESSGNDVTAEILEERQNQLVALGQIGESGVSVDDAEVEVIEETSAIIRPGFPNSKSVIDRKKEIMDRVDVYSSKNGKKNALRARLRDVENSGDNLELLIEMREGVEDELRDEINGKILTILDTERKKAQKTEGKNIIGK